MNKSNIEKLLSVVRASEAEALEEKLTIQHGAYVFDDPPEIAVRDPYKGPLVIHIREAYIYEEGPERDLMVSGYYNDPDDGHEVSMFVDIEENDYILPGEILLLTEQIPSEYTDPALVEAGWKKLSGTHVCKDIEGKDAEVVIDSESRTITVKNRDDQKAFSGKEADKMVHDVMLKDGNPGAMKRAIQNLYDNTNIDLPF